MIQTALGSSRSVHFSATQKLERQRERHEREMRERDEREMRERDERET